MLYICKAFCTKYTWSWRFLTSKSIRKMSSEFEFIFSTDKCASGFVAIFFWIKIQLQILVYLIFDSRRRSIMSMKCTYASHCMHTWVIMVRKRADNLFIFFLFLVNHNNLSLVFLSVYSPNAWNFVNLLASNECYSIAQNEKNHHHSCDPHEWHLVFKKHLLEIFQWIFFSRRGCCW